MTWKLRKSREIIAGKVVKSLEEDVEMEIPRLIP
jgi:hypothetical protein